MFEQLGRRLPEGAAPFVLTIEILWIAIDPAEYPSVGILTAHLHPFVPTVSSEKLSPSSLLQNRIGPPVLLFRKGNSEWHSSRVGAALLQSRFGRYPDADANDH